MNQIRGLKGSIAWNDGVIGCFIQTLRIVLELCVLGHQTAQGDQTSANCDSLNNPAVR